MKADNNYRSYVKESNIVIKEWENPSTPSIYDDVMKFSDCENVQVSDVLVLGGKEDCIDAVRGKNYSFSNLQLYPLVNGITIKGSIDGVYFKDVRFETLGRDYSIELGQFDNYWTPGRKPTKNVTIENVSATSDKKIIIRVWDAEKPKIINSPNVKVIKIPKIIWYPYFLFRRWQIKK